MERLLVWLIAGFILSGCANTLEVMLPGRMYASSDGEMLQFSIETSTGNGKMTAFNQKTGERFAGEYSAFYRGQGDMYGNVGGTNVSLYQSPAGANGRGILVGDKGTTVTLYLEIAPGIRPTGQGIGTDQEGRRYEVFF